MEVFTGMERTTLIQAGFMTAALTVAGFFITTFVFSADAEAQYVLSLQDAIDIALGKSYDMKVLQLNLIQSEQNYLAAKYRFRTNVNLSLDTPIWSERISPVQVPNEIPVYNRFSTMRMNGGLTISQPLPTNGSISLQSTLYQSNEMTDIAETNTKPSSTVKGKTFYSSFGLVFNQPLFTYNTLKTGLKQTELNFERTSRQNKRSQLDLVYNVTNSFFTLYRLTRTRDINKETLDQKKSVYDLAKLKFEAGLIPEVEALQTEVDYASAQADLLSAEANVQRQQDQFKIDIGLMLSDSVAVKTDIEFRHFDIDLGKAISEGLAGRSEIRESEIDNELQKLQIVQVNARSEIKANLRAFYDFTGISDQNLDYSTGTNDLFDSSMEDLRRRPRNRGVTLTFTVPVWDWGVNKAEVASAQAVLKRQQFTLDDQKKTVENSIRDVVRRVTEAESRLSVLQKSQEVAQRSYDITLERFNNGEITSQDLALDSTRLNNTKMSYLNAYINYKLAVADLKRKTLWDFETNKPIE